MNIQSVNGVFLVIILFLAWPGYVAAHAKLVSSEPAADAVVEVGPTSILLMFNKPVESAFSSIRISNQNNEAIKTEKPGHKGSNEKTLQAVLPKLSSGKYKVKWRLVAKDGHKMKDEFSFSVK